MSLWESDEEVSGASNPVVVGANCAILTATLTRPADTNAYLSNDAIAGSTTAPAILTFAGAARANGGSGELIRANLCTNLATCNAMIRLNLFTTTVTLDNDNDPYRLLFTSVAVRIGWIDFPVLTSAGTGSTAAVASVTGSLPYVCAAADTAIYGRVQTMNGWTPASAQQLVFTLEARKN